MTHLNPMLSRQAFTQEKRLDLDDHIDHMSGCDEKASIRDLQKNPAAFKYRQTTASPGVDGDGPVLKLPRFRGHPKTGVSDVEEAPTTIPVPA